MSRESKLVKNTVVIAIGTFLPKLASFVILPILTYRLTKAEYGTYDLITILVSLLLPSVTLQIQSAAFRFLIDSRNDSDETRSIITNIFAFILPISLLALVILYFCLPGESTVLKLCICLYFLADIVVNGARQVCRGLDQNMRYSISAIVSAIGKLAFTLICVEWLKMGLLGSVVSLFVASLVSLLYLVFASKLYRYIRVRTISREKILKLLQYSWPMVPNSMSAWVMRVSDRLVVIAFMGVSMNAVYSIANKIPSLLNLAQNTFTLAWQENASIVSGDNDASEYYSQMFRRMLDLMVGLFGILIASTPILFRLLIRGDYQDAYNHIPILFCAMFFFGMAMFLGGIYVAYKRTRSVGMTTMVAAAINLVVDIATIHWIGLYAASGSTLVSYVFLFFYRIVDVQKIVRVRYDRTHLALVMLAIVVMSVLCFLRRPVLDAMNLALGAALFVGLNQELIRKTVKIVSRKLHRGAN